MKEKTNWKPFAICLAAFCLAAAGLLLLYMNLRPAAVKGSKTITLEVVYEDSSTETYTVETEAEYLEQAVSEMEGLTIDGSRTERITIKTAPSGLLLWMIPPATTESANSPLKTDSTTGWSIPQEMLHE